MAQENSAQNLAHILAQEQQARKNAQLNNETSHGSAGWAEPSDTAAAGLHNGLFFMGHAPQGFLYYSGDGHCLTFGPTGSGKGVSVVVPNLLLYPGSVVCIDPKGAIAAVTAKQRRALGQKIVLLDPFAEVESAMKQSGKPQSWQPIERNSYNPLGQLNPASLDLVDDVRRIAASLIQQESEKNRYFSDSARNVLECMILYLLSQAGQSGMTFENLFALAFSDKNQWLPHALQSDAFGGHVAHLARQVEQLTGDGGNSVWSTLNRSLNLIKSPRLLPALRPSALDFRSLKNDKSLSTVYLVLPAKHLHTHSVWLRLMLTEILHQLSDARPSKYPVLFLIDECAALGRLEILETAVALMRGYGMKLWLIFQDLPQLQSTYSDRWGSFISNAGVKQFFNVNDTVTANFVSEYLGMETRSVTSTNMGHGQLGAGGSISATGRSLMTPDEVRRMGRDDQILLYEGMKPIEAKKVRYHNNDGLREMAAPDPYIIGR